MKASPPHDELMEMAALHALDILSRDEARAFEDHLAEGCPACETELRSFNSVVGDLGLAAQDFPPRPGLKEELMARLAESEPSGDADPPVKSGRGQFVSILAGEGEWREICKGVLLKLLSVDESSGYATSLVRMLPGTSLPMHEHTGVEQFYVLEGDCKVQGEVLGPGDYHKAMAGSIHETTFTEGGTLFLLIAPDSYRMTDRV
jgi:anti-sigma factor ChrR (cupin superfamily)